jgi:hypothetical protein
MKSFASLAAICAVALSAEATKANAATLDFNFSFSNIFGTVTGEIDGLSDNNTGPASVVFLDSFPLQLGPTCLPGFPPCNTRGAPWAVSSNVFTVTNGQIATADFDTTNAFSGGELTLTPGLGMLLGTTGVIVEGFATFSSVATPVATPLPAALPLFATGLGALGLLGWRRKRKSRVAVA